MKQKLRRWLAETHSTSFELVRHFLGRFFDSDLVTEPGQWTKVLVTAFALLLPAFFLLAQVLHQKYRYFSGLPTPMRYRQAVRADQLWLITLTMSIVGLLTAVQWQSLFPVKRDYLALGTLPVRPREIFLAKFLALFLLISAVIATLNALPSILFPIVSMGRWQTNSSLVIHIAAHAAACILASYFIFFTLLAVQGLLLNLFRPSWFAGVTSYVQGAATILTLAGVVTSFSIGPSVLNTLLQPQVARWLPPVWFLGFYQQALGDEDPYFTYLSRRALAGIALAVIAALVSYLISYRRHRSLAVEGLPASSAPGDWAGRLLGLVISSPPQQGIIVFMAKTLARSGQHRLVLMGYLGFSLAVILTGIAGIPAVMKPDRVLLASFSYAHMVLLLFVAAGLRQVFSIPSELRANWTFQVNERHGRQEWLRAVDRLATVPVLFVILALPAPFEIALLGWRGAAEALLFGAAYLLLFEALFHSWQKLPFTCSYLPGQQNGFIVVFRVVSVLTILSVVHLFFMACLFSPGLYGFVLALILTMRTALRRSRRDTWSYTPLRFVEEPEPAVRSLNLGTV